MAARDVESRLASVIEPPRRPSLEVRLKYVLLICGVPIAVILLSYSLRGNNAFFDTPAGWFIAAAIAVAGILYVGIGAAANRLYLDRVHKLGRADLVFRFTTNRMFRKAAVRAVGQDLEIIDSSRCAISVSKAGFVIWAGARPKRVVSFTWENVTIVEVARLRHSGRVRYGMHISYYDKFGMSGSMLLPNTNSGIIPLPSQAEARFVVAEMRRLRDLGLAANAC